MGTWSLSPYGRYAPVTLLRPVSTTALPISGKRHQGLDAKRACRVRYVLTDEGFVS